ncbi:LuxR C-terminal-related transcriptional regulator [Streptomyces sp. TRM72054]|nr:LuxR C-terminal-related transcriptional regulator [Streptomyces sp. TRM72054]
MADALAALDETAPGTRTIYSLLGAPLLVQATTASPTLRSSRGLDNAAKAIEVLDDLSQNAPALLSTTHWLHARLATARGHSNQALSHYRQALDTPVTDDDIPLHRALCHHDLACHLLTHHQAHHRLEATQHLQLAVQRLTALRATPHAQRATAGLESLLPTSAAVGGNHDVSDPAAQLTERERSVSHLAARGLTNKEIAHELFVSAKTVEYHLGHVYAKLQLSGRRQLRRVFEPV